MTVGLDVARAVIRDLLVAGSHEKPSTGVVCRRFTSRMTGTRPLWSVNANYTSDSVGPVVQKTR